MPVSIFDISLNFFLFQSLEIGNRKLHKRNNVSTIVFEENLLRSPLVVNAQQVPDALAGLEIVSFVICF